MISDSCQPKKPV